MGGSGNLWIYFPCDKSNIIKSFLVPCHTCYTFWQAFLTMLLGVFITFNAILHHWCQHSRSLSTTDRICLPVDLSQSIRQFCFLIRLVSGCRKPVSYSTVTQITPQSKHIDSGSSVHWLLMEREPAIWWAGNVGAALQKNRRSKNIHKCLAQRSMYDFL